MGPEALFRYCGDLAILGWLLLVFAGRLRIIAGLVCGLIIPSLIGVVYTAIIVLHWHERCHAALIPELRLFVFQSALLH